MELAERRCGVGGADPGGRLESPLTTTLDDIVAAIVFVVVLVVAAAAAAALSQCHVPM